jgi:hypothetical protein
MPETAISGDRFAAVLRPPLCATPIEEARFTTKNNPDNIYLAQLEVLLQIFLALMVGSR